MAYFRVRLRYSCGKHHLNQVERFYEEEDQECVATRVCKDKLVCYGCEPPHRINPPSRVALTYVSDPIDALEFERLVKGSGTGSDYNVEVSTMKVRKRAPR